ncbi:MAG: nuclear transport factor 2 family protein [Chitinophagaceae bacterium]|nr:nuclear transport factor 2 family protein [Chitinophagaceae bacterium]
MRNQIDAIHLGSNWIDDWNNKSVEEYMNLYDENATLISTIAKRIVAESQGRFTGKDILKNYWELLRDKYPNMKLVFQRAYLYRNKIAVHFLIPALDTEATALLSLNESNKISMVELSHV